MRLSDKIIKTIDFYNNHSEEYSENISGKIPTNRIYKFSKLLKPKGKILDVGCAAGRDSREFIKLGFSVIGIDLSEGLIKIARKKDNQSTYTLMDMRSLKFDNNSFDGVYASASLLHLETIEDVEKTIKEFYRVLCENGAVYISLKEQLGVSKTEVVKEKLSIGNPRFFQYFKKNEIIDILEKNKFKVIDIIKTTGDREIKVLWISLIAVKST